jgi:uncharacterized hydrophobic protein (TIGR00271 family)|tara:strand:- start:1811 stop:3220 length:1410 start_codon:yes stop_codon:yes gene_type:complete
VETKFDFNDNSKEIKKNASGLFNALILFIKKLFNITNDVDKNLVVNSIKKDISMRGTTSWILVCSILIASVGLNADSTAVVIGAMLISPLMGPILGLGFSIATNDINTLKNSSSNFIAMVLISVLTAFIFFLVFPIKDQSSELLTRTEFDIRDVLIAFFGGLALIIAKTKKENISTAIFGVAIATALMPPLCTAGFYLAIYEIELAVKAMYLFIINSMYIIVATYLVLKFLQFPLLNYTNSSNRKLTNRILTFISLLIMILPIITFVNAVNKANFEKQAKLFLNDELVGIANYKYLIESANSDFENQEIILNNYGQKPLSDDIISLLKNKLQNYKSLDKTTLVFKQQELNMNSNSFIRELRLRDSIELVEKTVQVEQLSREIKELKELSKEKLLFDQIAKEASVIYPDLKQFEIFEKIRTDFNSTKKILVVNVKWDSSLLSTETERLNSSLRRWLEFQFESDDFIIENN